MCPREQIVSNTIKMQKKEKKDAEPKTNYIFQKFSCNLLLKVQQSCDRCKFALKNMTDKILFDIARNFEQRVNVLHFLRSMNPRVLDIMIRENVQLKNKVLQILPVILKRIQVSVFVFCSYVFTHASNCSTIFLPELMNFYLFSQNVVQQSQQSLSIMSVQFAVNQEPL